MVHFSRGQSGIQDTGLMLKRSPRKVPGKEVQRTSIKFGPKIQHKGALEVSKRNSVRIVCLMGLPGSQWFRICLAMQGTWVLFLVRKEPTCYGATKLMGHNYRAHELQLLKPMLHRKRSHCDEKPVPHKEENVCSPQLEKASIQQRRPSTAKITKNKNK